MKKQITIIMALMLIFLLTACAAAEPTPSETEILVTATETVPAESATVPPETETSVPQKIVPVEITLDNWQEYFELRQTEQVYVSQTCAVTNRVFGYGVFLKEEFLPLLAPDSDVSFELQYDVVWKRVMGDLASDSYAVIGSLTEAIPKTQVARLADFRENAEVPEDSDFYGQAAAEFAFDSEFGA